MTDSQKIEWRLPDVITAKDQNGKKVTVKRDKSLYVEDGCDLDWCARLVARESVSLSVGFGVLFTSISHPLVISVDEKQISIQKDGEVVADPAWSQEVVEFAKLIGKHFAGFYDIAVENERLRERIAELESQAQKGQA